MPGAGTITNTEVGVHGLVYQDRLYNNRWLISELVGMEREGWYGIYRDRMESIRGFLLYVSSTYRYMTPYMKGVYLTLDSWIPFRYEEGCRLRG